MAWMLTLGVGALLSCVTPPGTLVTGDTGLTASGPGEVSGRWSGDCAYPDTTISYADVDHVEMTLDLDQGSGAVVGNMSYVFYYVDSREPFGSAHPLRGTLIGNELKLEVLFEDTSTTNLTVHFDAVVDGSVMNGALFYTGEPYYPVLACELAR